MKDPADVLHWPLACIAGRLRCRQFLLCLLSMTPIEALPQAVQVTATLDTNIINVGESTTLRIFAQVLPEVEADAQRIFSWYVDVLNSDGTVAGAEYSALVKVTSDNDPSTSGNGTDDGDNRRGIYDTFLNLPGAGVGAPVELMSIPVTGNADGVTIFEVAHGSTVGLSEDFIVGRLGGGDPLTGGDYSGSAVVLQVGDVPPCSSTLPTSLSITGGPGEEVILSFLPCVGYDHVVQSTDGLGTGGAPTVWLPLPGAPHNSGSVTVTVLSSVSTQFYRVVATPQ